MQGRVLRASYDGSAAAYDLRFRDLQVEKYRALLGPVGARLAEVRAHSGCDRVLDLGCGTGLLAEFARACGQPTIHWVGVDFSPRMLARGRRRSFDAGAVAIVLTLLLREPAGKPESRPREIAEGVESA
ncbi:MAG: methyltransferase domain-containing protein [Candidatus Binatia bacterium]